jgi:hypothetical protein
MYRYNINGETGINLAAATAKTVAAISTPSTRKARLLGFTAAWNSVTSTDASVLVEIVRYTTATGTGTLRTPRRIDPNQPAALCEGVVNYTAEPTVVEVAYETLATPVGGTLIMPFVPEEALMAAVSQILGIRLTAPQAQTGMRISLTFEE